MDKRIRELHEQACIEAADQISIRDNLVAGNSWFITRECDSDVIYIKITDITEKTIGFTSRDGSEQHRILKYSGSVKFIERSV